MNVYIHALYIHICTYIIHLYTYARNQSQIGVGARAPPKLRFLVGGVKRDRVGVGGEGRGIPFSRS